MKLKTMAIPFLAGALFLGGCAGSEADLERQEKSAKLHYQIGLDALQKNRLPKAFDELMLAEKLNPEMPETLDALAFAWRLRGNQKKSEQYYKKAIRAGSGSKSYTNYGSLLIEMKRYKDAKNNLLKALEDPRYHGQFIATLLLGDACMGLEQYEEAIDNYRKAGSFKPDQTLTRFKEAEAFVALKRIDFALATYESLLREQPNNVNAMRGVLMMLKLKGDKVAASQKLQAFIGNPSVADRDRTWATAELLRLR